MSLNVEYEQVLRNFLNGSSEVDLLRAYELGKRFQSQQTSPDELIGLHLEALQKLPAELGQVERTQEILKSFSVLIETMIAYGIAYSDAYRLLESTSREAEEAKFDLERTIVDLDLANQQLHEVDRLKTQFFSNMSHELRTPLNAIIGFAEDTLEGLAGEVTPKQKRYVGNILSAGQHLLTVINDILDLAKLQAGKTWLDMASVSLQSLFGEIEDTVSTMIARKSQHLTVSVSSDLPVVEGDRAKVFQIVLNLVSNAHKYTPEGGHITLSAQLEGHRVTVSVEDDGIGIPAEALPTLFEEFQQVESKNGLRQQGSGLGLAIVKRLVEMHSGTVSVTSEPGRGSKFNFDLAVASDSL